MKQSAAYGYKNIGKVELSPAYKSMDLIDERGHPIFSQEKGEKKLKGMVEGEGIMKPLYYQEVDHNIEEVKYVTEKQWQKMIAMQKDHEQIWKYLESISNYEKRFEIAKRIPRNNKGQFSSSGNNKKQQKTQPIKKRGRPKKNQAL